MANWNQYTTKKYKDPPPPAKLPAWLQSYNPNPPLTGPTYTAPTVKQVAPQQTWLQKVQAGQTDLQKWMTGAMESAPVQSLNAWLQNYFPTQKPAKTWADMSQEDWAARGREVNQGAGNWLATSLADQLFRNQLDMGHTSTGTSPNKNWPANVPTGKDRGLGGSGGGGGGYGGYPEYPDYPTTESIPLWYSRLMNWNVNR